MICFRKPVSTFRDHARAGFTLIEVVVALALIAVALTAIGSLIATTIRGTRSLDQHLSLEPVMPGSEEAKVTVPKGFDPAEIRLIGEAHGEPPLRGTLRHHGWRVVDAKLPALADGVDRTVIAPAEVER